ncbi:Mitochondrial S-adenosylmethionine transporter [Taphrina deformans PYCC 5710]|uniref:Mitochondrial S-adenosylmethionine transporter n=1 Tax=Taphrina deformans (strain PYCC 5710 / ATCC 11124 / CBS 356.35 / IMI 108563 / JCM 9778 / NBRC 8474) TaxID=1097556 RepID=R4X878_TAPDE|nr:Mitochondrial S-adenosylmethionine transporter [Taphrina deformans PYCC 5710]|eukprot:CCG81467.1 Mitochondrial S-adenosylmethionine transporter [Taphrina deformans PYCC 5710]
MDAGCSPENLRTLASCELPGIQDLTRLLGSASRDCSDELTKTTRNAFQFLRTNGCLDSMPHIKEMSKADTMLNLLQQPYKYSNLTTCFAHLMSARRAFVDALSQETQSKIAPAPPEGITTTITSTPSAVTEGHEAPVRGPSLWIALVAGALAGLAVDLSLFPLDTIKTRLQSTSGFRASGGFRGLYQGIGSIALGSAPSSALFFLAYTFAGTRIARIIGETVLGHLAATTIAELAASVVRVPADVVKSRQQVEQLGGSVISSSLWTAIAKVYEEGTRPNSRSRFGVFYTGWLSTIVREIPFGCIQFPLFEFLKSVANQGEAEQLSMFRTAVCGMMAGSVAGFLTTPLDVVKTRIMLAEHGATGIFAVLARIIRQDGFVGLFKGALPRTLWISAGGAIFLGGYDGFVRAFETYYTD